MNDQTLQYDHVCGHSSSACSGRHIGVANAQFDPRLQQRIAIGALLRHQSLDSGSQQHAFDRGARSVLVVKDRARIAASALLIVGVICVVLPTPWQLLCDLRPIM